MFGTSNMIMISSHIGHMEDLPQGLITAVIHLHQVSNSEAIVVLVLGDLRRQMLKSSFCVLSIVRYSIFSVLS